MSTTMERPGCSSDSGTQRHPTRLLKRPPSLNIVPAPANNWTTAIPLLSPLALLPESPVNQPPVENQTKAITATVAPVFKTWQHPAAPFCYEPSSTFVPPFVPVQNHCFQIQRFRKYSFLSFLVLPRSNGPDLRFLFLLLCGWNNAISVQMTNEKIIKYGTV